MKIYYETYQYCHFFNVIFIIGIIPYFFERGGGENANVHDQLNDISYIQRLHLSVNRCFFVASHFGD